MNKYQEAYDELVIRLFKAVGKVPPKPEDYSKLPDRWYCEKLWTEADYDQFKKGAVEYLRKKLRMSKRKAEDEAGMFLLDYGWGFRDA